MKLRTGGCKPLFLTCAMKMVERSSLWQECLVAQEEGLATALGFSFNFIL
jgi:hypothetical protein